MRHEFHSLTGKGMKKNYAAGAGAKKLEDVYS